MTTSHFCEGKWKPGPIEECPKHKRLSKSSLPSTEAAMTVPFFRVR